ncbi:3-phosphoshikimate 1-carboxyvinyltransferase [Streptomyces odontomachi]|uniref:3-phosphoshikimate 1-carboxyvinyltransferase n=1 Tax=Streptomyces odontomachi TaxID=2944940 RepID=UPI00210CC3BC|nr:3-phosphoshikimate 1-carboxyvinyltransferase [Streptomyces sp. ODS25]
MKTDRPSGAPGALDEETAVRLHGPCAVRGTLRVPGDKSISHRALLLAGLARGRSLIRGLSTGDDVRHTRQALGGFGVGFTETAEGLTVDGGLRDEPDGPLDMGNAGTGIRLLAGVCAGQPMFTVLTGDRYLRARPMDRVAQPLRAMGAVIDGRNDGSLAPLAIRGGTLSGITYRVPVASAQVKSSVLLAGLHAKGRTVVIEPTVTRRHTEEMLPLFGATVAIDGTEVEVRASELHACDVTVPGDPSQAAFWVVAGLTAADSEVVVEQLYTGPGRGGFVDVLRRMGGDLDVDTGTGTIRVRSSRLRGVRIGPQDIPDMVDEVPVIAVAAALAEGTTVISGAAELRVKESDRISSTAAMLRAFGAQVTETDDGMVIEGGRALHGGIVDSHGDHRISMAAVVGALSASGETVITGWDSVATSYRGFAADLQKLTSGAEGIAAAPADTTAAALT